MKNLFEKYCKTCPNNHKTSIGHGPGYWYYCLKVEHKPDEPHTLETYIGFSGSQFTYNNKFQIPNECNYGLEIAFENDQ